MGVYMILCQLYLSDPHLLFQLWQHQKDLKKNPKIYPHL